MSQPDKNMDFLMKALECPVCLDVISDPPIFQCDNTQCHSFCSLCHGSLLRDKKSCPVCQSQLGGRRNIVLENIAQGFPDKIKCKFEACDFKKMSEETVRAHEEECDNRYVPCAHCDVKITLRCIEKHVIDNHQKQETFPGFGIPRHDLGFWPKEDYNMQIVYRVEGEDPGFLFNLKSEDSGPTIVWISCISPRTSLAKSYKYTFQLRNGKDASAGNGYSLEGTRRCVPCDLSHDEVRKLGCCIGIDKETIADVIGNIEKDNRLHLTITISKV